MAKARIMMVYNPSRRLSLSFCTAVEAEAVVPAISGGVKENVLYDRLLRLRGSSVVETLDQYIREGNSPSKSDLDFCVTQLRKSKKSHLALQVMEWIGMRTILFSPTDHTRCLDLISEVKGITAAENYFSGLLLFSNSKYTYGTLLNCYCKKGLTDKAEALFKKMDKMDMVSSFTFNSLMALYMRINKPEKVPPLVEEMKYRNISLDMFSYNIWITSYTSLNDIEGAEKVFEELKLNYGKQFYGWTTYTCLATAYIKAGIYEKAESVLQKIEEHIQKMERHFDDQPFLFLITLYAGTLNLGKVHNIWKCLKSSFKFTTSKSTLIMLQSLAKLDDINGFKEVFDEWELSCSGYDKRLAKEAIRLYLKHGMIEEAEKVYHQFLKRCKGRTSYGYCELLISRCLENCQIDFALKFLEATISEVKNNEWHPTPEHVNKLMEYYKNEGDVNGAEKLCEIVKKVTSLNYIAYKFLLETYVAANKTSTDMRQRIIDDGVEISFELEDLLRKVCLEESIIESS